MTSTVTTTYSSINENFPVPGQDNDTQVFRDNFDTIKTSLRHAGEEITDLQSNVARTDIENDFNQNLITNATNRNNRDAVYDAGAITAPFSIDYSNGSYHKLRVGNDIVLGFTEFPSNTSSLAGVGKAVVEIYSDGTERTITLDPSNSVTYKKRNWPVSPGGNAFKVSSSSNPVFIEVWKYSNDIIYINYIGLFE